MVVWSAAGRAEQVVLDFPNKFVLGTRRSYVRRRRATLIYRTPCLVRRNHVGSTIVVAVSAWVRMVTSIMLVMLIAMKSAEAPSGDSKVREMFSRLSLCLVPRSHFLLVFLIRRCVFYRSLLVSFRFIKVG